MRDLDVRTETIRDFNRFYTRHIGALGNSHLGSDFSLTEARVLYELAHRDRPTATEIREALELDRGYLSRVLRAFKKRGLIATQPSPTDRRQTHLSLTAAGRKAFAPLNRKARRLITGVLEPLADAEQDRLLGAMQIIRRSLEPAQAAAADQPREAFTLRSHRSGDMGWIVHRQGVLYAQEYGWGERFEAIVARIVADFIDHLDPAKERCWIAERDGEIVGSIFVVKQSKTVAKLRLLYVEPSARGLGIGARLVDEVIAFSRAAGYKKIVLWTQSNLAAARKIYNAKGFEITGHEGHELFGSASVAETWELSLG